FRYLDFLHTDIKLEWVLEGLVEKAGLSVVSGPPSHGKTTFALNEIIALINRPKFLVWNVQFQPKILFVSLEMGHAELKHFAQQLHENLSEEEAERLQEYFFLYPVGHALPFHDKNV